ncbi:MAG: uncharacterized protein KVP18_001196 [Porospora cf. gigantea A]|uniref:uncharacterized protein n=1 Tax=Porospora cf. gigantea A TaxID=2853593 RepID=UPI0035597812|nr:MAG: hypothetical protein KVP18_001196 [Porospora cf. gigantea A]
MTSTSSWNYEVCYPHGVNQFRVEDNRTAVVSLGGLPLALRSSQPFAALMSPTLSRPYPREAYQFTSLPLASVVLPPHVPTSDPADPITIWPDDQGRRQQRLAQHGLVLSLADGDACEGGRRQTKIFMFCPKSLGLAWSSDRNTAKITSVREVGPCFHHVFLAVPLLCSHPHLVTPQPLSPPRLVLCSVKPDQRATSRMPFAWRAPKASERPPPRPVPASDVYKVPRKYHRCTSRRDDLPFGLHLRSTTEDLPRGTIVTFKGLTGVVLAVDSDASSMPLVELERRSLSIQSGTLRQPHALVWSGDDAFYLPTSELNVANTFNGGVLKRFPLCDGGFVDVSLWPISHSSSPFVAEGLRRLLPSLFHVRQSSHVRAA